MVGHAFGRVGLKVGEPVSHVQGVRESQRFVVCGVPEAKWIQIKQDWRNAKKAGCEQQRPNQAAVRAGVHMHCGEINSAAQAASVSRL